MPSYTNTLAQTSVSTTWSLPIDYSSLSLISGIPHSAQLEVERIFTTDRDSNPISTFLNNANATVSDKRNVFIIPNTYFTFNETTKTITATSLNNYDFDPDGVGLSNVKVPNLSSGQSIKIRRKSVSNTELVSWTAGNKLTSNQLNLQTQQLLYLSQEILDRLNTEYTSTNIQIGTIADFAVTPAKLSTGGPSWTSNGNVGIGISPSAKLHISSGAVDETLRLEATGANGPYLSFYRSGTRKAYIQQASSLLYISNEDASATIALATAGLERMRIDSTGNVGIGTSSVSSPLHVKSGSTNTLRLETTDNINNANAACYLSFYGSAGRHGYLGFGGNANTLDIWNDSGSGTVRFGNSGVERMRIDAAGNVGIGNPNPGLKLSVGTTGTGSDGINIINLNSGAYGSLHAQGSVGGIASWANGFVLEGVPASTGNTILSSYTGNLSLHTARTERLRIESGGDVSITSTTGSTSATTGALKVAGGIGASGAIIAASQVSTLSLTNPPAANTGTAAVLMYATSIGIYACAGVPTFSAAKGSLCINTSASAANTRLYINNNGTTGWSAITSA